jgi:hypothetical protein
MPQRQLEAAENERILLAMQTHCCGLGLSGSVLSLNVGPKCLDDPIDASTDHDQAIEIQLARNGEELALRLIHHSARCLLMCVETRTARRPARTRCSPRREQ